MLRIPPQVAWRCIELNSRAPSAGAIWGRLGFEYEYDKELEYEYEYEWGEAGCGREDREATVLGGFRFSRNYFAADCWSAWIKTNARSITLVRVGPVSSSPPSPAKK